MSKMYVSFSNNHIFPAIDTKGSNKGAKQILAFQHGHFHAWEMKSVVLMCGLHLGEEMFRWCISTQAPSHTLTQHSVQHLSGKG